MKYYLIAGERSGDMHGAHLIKELLANDPRAKIRCWGGDQMEEAGGELVVHYKFLSFMGIWEVFTNLLTIRKYMEQCKQDMINYKPDVVVLIDYPGFNMRMAEFAHKQGLKVGYFISPKLWAWNQKRAKKIKQYVDRMYCILPFERQFYQKFDYQVDYVGNPLVKTISGFKTPEGFLNDPQSNLKPIIAILPGSRKQEIQSMLKVMLELVDELPQYRFVVAAVDNVPEGYYQPAIEHKEVALVTNKAYELLSVAQAAVVTSGTASLETALFDVPQVVCYKTSWLTYWTGRVLIKVPYLSLVNLIAGNQVVPELIQKDYHKENVLTKLKAILPESPERKNQLAGYRKVKMLLGNKDAAKEAARLLQEFLRSQSPELKSQI